MEGTIRTFDPEMRDEFHARIRRTAERIAEIAGAKATVTIDGYAPVTNNSHELTERAMPSLRWAAGAGNVHEFPRMMWAEDFAFYQEQVLKNGEHTDATPGRAVRGPGWTGWKSD